MIEQVERFHTELKRSRFVEADRISRPRNPRCSVREVGWPLCGKTCQSGLNGAVVNAAVLNQRVQVRWLRGKFPSCPGT